MIKGVAVAVALALGLGAAQAQEKLAGKLKVGFIYVGPVADFGYSFQHDQSRKALLAAMPDKVETSFLENVPEADSERSIESLARSGHQLIFTTSFGFMEPTLKVAKKFPKVKFEHATGYKRSANVSTYSARFYEGRYICGEIAGRLSKTGTVGYIASFPIPEVVSGINAFMLGAQSVNPNIKLKIVWVNTWFDPGKEAEAAKALLAQGADILSQHTDSAAPLQEAEKQGKFAFGQSSDQMRFAPKAQLTSIVDDWDGYVIGEAKAVLDGTWKSHDTWGGIKEGMVVLAPFANMPDDVKAKAEASKKAIADGTLHPFKGPVLKQDGSVAVKEGETAPDPMILGMNWYVKGIDDKLPN
ncbi:MULTISPECIES: BMP family ABC transporter substrate-binding protein [unclassified Methylobacterium]|uniref:BMP family ABC transporter substrate-binding protein n=1 Tax=unclassified Methylobacterium TaxID=2615210 RepID=UPI0006F7EFA0|nr:MULTISPECIES: BMP family ABC transporter substrate-binding protein [unclassified Methylobacterium]KQO58344.1 ABC transporter substrate-binding protein [Methylobacterium sp. Leaf86]KQO97298.1 ABC transporter substrate-binding protein [Methylobacterium sp. Leaf91]